MTMFAPKPPFDLQKFLSERANPSARRAAFTKSQAVTKRKTEATTSDDTLKNSK